MTTEEISNSGWADAMARVLRSRKPKKSRSIVLSRARKLNKDPKTTEVNGCALKQEVPSSNEHSKGRKLGLQPKCRIKPNILDRDLERKLNRIATKGVVQLFNVVRQQQKNLETQLKKAGASELRRDIVMKSLDKRVFLDVLMGTKHNKIEPQLKKEEEPSPEWKVLHDDFMMGTAKLKDWDKNDSL